MPFAWLSASFQSLPPLPTSKLGPFGTDSQVGGFVYILGPCESLQWTLLWGLEFLLVPQPPQVIFIRGFEALFPQAESLGYVVCLTPHLFLLVYLHVKVGPPTLPATALPTLVLQRPPGPALLRVLSTLAARVHPSHWSGWMFFFFSFFLKFYLFVRRERREEERKRNIDVHTSISCLLYTPIWGPGPQPRRVPWLGIESATFHSCRLLLHPVSHTRQGKCFFLNSLVVGFPYNSIFWQFWLFLFLNLLSFWLWEEAKCIYRRLHLGCQWEVFLFLFLKKMRTYKSNLKIHKSTTFGLSAFLKSFPFWSGCNVG